MRKGFEERGREGGGGVLKLRNNEYQAYLQSGSDESQGIACELTTSARHGSTREQHGDVGVSCVVVHVHLHRTATDRVNDTLSWEQAASCKAAMACDGSCFLTVFSVSYTAKSMPA